jgi:hypothetical protein
MMKIPTTLKTQTVIVGEGYGSIDGRYAYKTDVQGLSLDSHSGTTGASGYFRQGVEIYGREMVQTVRGDAAAPRAGSCDFRLRSGEIFREAYRYEKLYDPENPVIDRVGLQGDAMTVKVCTENDMIDEDIKQCVRRWRTTANSLASGLPCCHAC